MEDFDMGDSLDDMIALTRLRREERAERSRTNLANADTKGWKKLDTYHFRRYLVGGGYVDWWPSTKKFAFIGMGADKYKAKYRIGDPNEYAARKGKVWL